MPEYGEGKVLGTGAELHGNHHLLHQICGRGTHDMGPQDPVGLLMGQQLDQPVGIVGGQGTAAR